MSSFINTWNLNHNVPSSMEFLCLINGLVHDALPSVDEDLRNNLIISRKKIINVCRVRLLWNDGNNYYVQSLGIRPCSWKWAKAFMRLTLTTSQSFRTKFWILRQSFLLYLGFRLVSLILARVKICLVKILLRIFFLIYMEFRYLNLLRSSNTILFRFFRFPWDF